jgi:hypothetical protein
MNGWLDGLLMRNAYRSVQNITLFIVRFSSASLRRTPNAYFQALRMVIYIYMSVWLLTPSISYSVPTCFSLSTTLRFYEFALTSIFRSPLCLDISIYNCHNFAFHCTVLYCHLYCRKGTEISHHKQQSYFQFPKCSTTSNTSASSKLLFIR